MTSVPIDIHAGFVNPLYSSPPDLILPAFSTVGQSNAGFYIFKDLYGSSLNYPVRVQGESNGINTAYANDMIENPRGFLHAAITENSNYSAFLELTSPMIFTGKTLYTSTINTCNSLVSEIHASTIILSNYTAPSLYSVSSIVPYIVLSTLSLSNVTDSTVSSLFYSSSQLWVGDKIISPEVKINQVLQSIPSPISWTPASIPNLQVWFDAKDASTMFTDTALTTNVNVNDSVCVWLDKSSNLWSSVQTSVPNQPIYNGISVYFQPGAYMNTVFPTYSTMTFMVAGFGRPLIVNPYVGVTYYFMSELKVGSSNWGTNLYSVASYDAPSFTFTNDVTPVTFDLATLVTPPKFQCYTLFTRPDPTLGILTRRNGLNVTYAVNNNPYTATCNIQYLGDITNGATNTYFGDWVVYDRWLEENEIQKLESYFMWKYGVQSDIPPVNPFANSSP